MKNKKTIKYKYNPNEWEESKSVEVTPEKGTKSELSTSIRLPKAMVQKLKKIASKKGEIGYQTLIKMWIAERLDDEAA